MNQTESSKVMQVKNNSQRKLLLDFFQAEEQRRQKEETLNRAKTQKEEALNQAKTEINEALTVYQKLESNLLGFTRPKHQLDIYDDRIERVKKVKEKLLLDAQANFLESADAYASNVTQLGREILQKIEDYRQAKSDASSSIQQMRSEWQNLNNRKSVKYIKSELSTLQNQLNSAEQHFEADTISDYRQFLEISRQVSSRISELTRLADQRGEEHQRKIPKLRKGIGYGVSIGILLAFAGAPFGVVKGTIIGAIFGFILGFALGWFENFLRSI